MTFKHKLSARLALIRAMPLVLALALGACTDSPSAPELTEAATIPTLAVAPPGSVTLVGAGSIARCDKTNDNVTANLLDQIPGTVFTTGDNVYDSGSASDFADCYASNWGRHKARTRPAAGDLDHQTSGASGYFGYFGSQAGPTGQGYYSYDLGDWHVVVLNSAISMDAGSPQEQWLRADLAASPRQCTVAYWHHPRFSSYSTYVRGEIEPVWDALYAAGADVVVNGHYRLYERFGPQTPTGQADVPYGIRQFTVGTGGQGIDSFGTPQPNSQVRRSGLFGVLKLTLSSGGYGWEFVRGSGVVADSGTDSCHGAPGAPAVSSVDVTPGAATVVGSGTTQLTAVARDGSGAIVTGAPMSWSSRDTLVARVTASGLVTAAALGTAYVVATSGGLADSAAVTVTPVPIASVAVSPATASLTVGGTQQLAATPQDSAGNPLTGRTINWSSSNAAVATVSASGLVTALAAGTAAITATSGGVNGSAAVSVTAPAQTPCTPTGSGVCRYVDAGAGNDANPGTSGQPYRTLQKAAAVVNPGDVVVVRNGRYTGGAIVLNIGRSGTAANWIVFRAETRWGAVIDGQNNGSTGGINISSRYIRVEGFEVHSTNRYGIEAYGGSDVVVAQNHIHDIGHICTSSSGGIVGINAYVPNLVIEQNLVHDIGRFAPGQNGCTTTNNYWQNHDHGIYQGEGDNLVVRNNVFYGMTRGWAFQRYNGAGIAVTSLQIVNNTFVGANPNKDGQIIIASSATGLVITNNIFHQPRTAALYFDNPGLVAGTIANNLTYGASLSTGSTLGMVVVGNLTGDPRFVNAAGYDFRLQPGSPAIDAGLVLSIVANDMGGLLRPQGVRHDIGAYEYR